MTESSLPQFRFSLPGQALGDQRTVAGLRVALDAQQSRGPGARQRRHDRREVDEVQDLGGVATDVLGSELATRSLTDPEALFLGVLEMTKRCRRGKLRVVLVGDPGIGKAACSRREFAQAYSEPRTARRRRTSSVTRTFASCKPRRKASPSKPYTPIVALLSMQSAHGSLLEPVHARYGVPRPSATEASVCAGPRQFPARHPTLPDHGMSLNSTRRFFLRASSVVS